MATDSISVKSQEELSKVLTWHAICLAYVDFSFKGRGGGWFLLCLLLLGCWFQFKHLTGSVITQIRDRSWLPCCVPGKETE